jgi:hypothetical protein
MSEGNGYIIAAYAITWVMILAYAGRLMVVAKRARDQLEQASRSGAGSAS